MVATSHWILTGQVGKLDMFDSKDGEAKPDKVTVVIVLWPQCDEHGCAAKVAS
jgi:hypothetical protein